MKRIIALLLALLLALLACFALTSCEGDGGADTGVTDGSGESGTNGGDDTSEPKKLLLVSGRKSALDVILPANCSDEVRTAAQSLVQKLYSLTGCAFDVWNDDADDGVTVDGENEIVIGGCHRAAAEELLDTLRYDDYLVTVTENSLIVACHSDDAATSAVMALRVKLKEENLLKEGDNIYLLWAEDLSYEREGYSYPEMTIGGKAVREYNIVYGVDEHKKYSLERAKELQAFIADKSGYVLDIVADNVSERKQDAEILVGKTNRAESLTYFSGGSVLDSMEYTVKLTGSKLIITGSSPFCTTMAVDEFENWLTAKKGKIDALDTGVMSAQTEFDACTSDYRIMQYNVLVEYAGWGSGGFVVADLEYRKDITASIINGYAPDVIVLCEVFEGWAKLLPSMLPDYTMVRAMRSDGKSNRTPIAYRTDKFTLIDSGYKDIYVTPDTTNNRVVTWAVLEDKITKERLVVFGTHWEVTSEENRVKQAEMAATLIKEITAKYEGTVIFAGDFNTRVGNEAYEKVKELTGYTDAVAKVAGVGVDHMFFEDSQVTVNSAVVDAKHNTQYASDHKPIICDIDLK